MNITRNYIFNHIYANIRTLLKTNTIKTIPIITKSIHGSIPIRETTHHNPVIFIPITILFGGLPFFNKEEETPEEKLITTIKRSILCIQREEYAKAEKMLHLALRMAQDLQHKDGITYIYDIMANLAMEQQQFPKAEKLFADVMKRMFGDGYKEEDIKILHISLKLAHMAHIQGNLDKAQQGFEWTITKIEKNIKNRPDDKDMQELWGLAHNWYAEYLMDKKKYIEAKKCFLNAYGIYTEKYGKLNQEAVTILNNLSVASSKLGDSTGAKKFLEEALLAANELPELCEAGILQANLGLLYLQDGLVDRAREECMKAWRRGKKCDHKQTIEQAGYCLDQVKEFKV